MPMSYRIDGELGVIFTTADGVLTEADLMEHKIAVRNDPGFQPGIVELADLRGIDRLDLDPQGIRRFVGQDRKDAERLADFRLAIVISEGEAFAMARMYQMSTEQYVPHVGVFQDLEEATVWLGREVTPE